MHGPRLAIKERTMGRTRTCAWFTLWRRRVPAGLRRAGAGRRRRRRRVPGSCRASAGWPWAAAAAATGSCRASAGAGRGRRWILAGAGRRRRRIPAGVRRPPGRRRRRVLAGAGRRGLRAHTHEQVASDCHEAGRLARNHTILRFCLVFELPYSHTHVSCTSTLCLTLQLYLALLRDVKTLRSTPVTPAHARTHLPSALPPAPAFGALSFAKTVYTESPSPRARRCHTRP